jgi:hypothetical protein
MGWVEVLGKRNTKAKALPLVLIEWQDSHGVSSEWQYLSQCHPFALVCKSVGWLVYDGRDSKVIVPHLTNSEHAKQQGCGDMTIPTAAVLKIVNLKETDRSRKR